jgi:hypothetical protein
MTINVFERNGSDCKYVEISTHRVGSIGAPSRRPKGPSTLLVLVLVRLVLVGRLVWLLLVLVNLRPHYFSCEPL